MPCFESEQWLPRERSEIFAFFSDPRNLEVLTPAWLRFRILNPSTVEMKRGALIDYRLRIHGIPARWRSEITVWEPPARFVDIQRRGPYRRWVHEHRFVEMNGGTRVTDRVDYSVPGGALIDRLFVRRDVRAIFEFRRKKLAEIFGADTEETKSRR